MTARSRATSGADRRSRSACMTGTATACCRAPKFAPTPAATGVMTSRPTIRRRTIGRTGTRTASRRSTTTATGGSRPTNGTSIGRAFFAPIETATTYLSRDEFVAANVDDDRNDRFEYLDHDNNGRIERDEWHGNDETFDWLDANNNGVLSRAEVAGAAAAGPPRPIRTAIRLRASTTTAMACSAAKSGTGRAAASMRAIPNNDGVISRREYAVSGTTSSSGGGSLHRELQVPATQQWTDTGIDVRAGDVIRVNADGTIQLSDNPNDRANPSGAGRRAPNAPVGTAPAGALLVRIGNSHRSTWARMAPCHARRSADVCISGSTTTICRTTPASSTSSSMSPGS